MTTLLLSGAGGSNNWLPLILPLVALLTIIEAARYLHKRIQKRRLYRENALIDKLTMPGSEVPPENEGNEI